MINEFLKGMNEGTNYVKTSGTIKDVSEGVKDALDGCGYSLVTSRDKNGINYRLEYNKYLRDLSYGHLNYVPKYNKDLFKRTMALVDSYIESSGAMNKSTRSEKVYAFSLKVKKEIPYFMNEFTNFDTYSGTPNSFLLLGKGSCTAYVYFNSIAFLKMNIPSISTSGIDKKGANHSNVSYLNELGSWEELNVTGYRDRGAFSTYPSEDVLNQYILKSMKEGRLRDYLYTKEENLRKSNIEKINYLFN